MIILTLCSYFRKISFSKTEAIKKGGIIQNPIFKNDSQSLWKQNQSNLTISNEMVHFRFRKWNVMFDAPNLHFTNVFVFQTIWNTKMQWFYAVKWTELRKWVEVAKNSDFTNVFVFSYFRLSSYFSPTAITCNVHPEHPDSKQSRVLFPTEQRIVSIR